MNDKLAFTQRELAAVGRFVCLWGLCLLTGVACNESHAPAMTSSAQPAASRAVSDKQTAIGDPTANDEQIGLTTVK